MSLSDLIRGQALIAGLDAAQKAERDGCCTSWGDVLEVGITADLDFASKASSDQPSGETETEGDR